ncbi:hypothetical protein CDAR_266891 [Caerostris darwini]|uniref:LAGLIDADG homing endonuclease n=1 Tax=Caerostris darwini TaxID=1538125 RepID=A0AAV4R551_9ARAC|nr:hypothetical protein CDAR_266891 [Caerostris darwini]
MNILNNHYMKSENVQIFGIENNVKDRDIWTDTAFQAVSPKLGYLCLRGKFNDYSIISLYRQKKKEDEEKDRFYEELDHLWGRCVQDMMYKL